MKCFDALVLVIYMANNAQFPCQVTHGSCVLFPNTQLCLLSMEKMAKLGFGPTLALYDNQKDPWRGHKMV